MNPPGASRHSGGAGEERGIAIDRRVFCVMRTIFHLNLKQEHDGSVPQGRLLTADEVTLGT